MMTACLHCVDGYPATEVAWVRKHAQSYNDGQHDYFTVRVSISGGEVTLFLSPAQLDSLATKLAQAGLNRQVVVEEEANPSQDAETGGGG